jgi:hypothetical protein
MKKIRKRYKTLRIYESDYPNLLKIKKSLNLPSLSDALRFAINTTMEMRK